MTTRVSIVSVILTFWLLTACGGAETKNESPSQEGSSTIEEGETLIEQGEIAAAAQVFEQIISKESGNAKAHYYLGMTKKNLGDPAAAEEHYRLAIGYDANLPAAHNNLGLLLLEKGDLVHAESELNTYLRQRPDDAAAHFNYGLVLEAQGDAAKAKEHYEKSSELDPEDSSPLLGLGDLARRADNLEGALLLYRKGKQLAPDSPEFAIKEGQTLLDLKRLDEGITVLETLPNLTESGPNILATAGVLLAKFDEDDRAISLYRAALAKDDSYAVAHLLLANALARKKQFAEAAGHYERFLAVAPNAPEVPTVKKRLEACKAQMK